MKKYNPQEIEKRWQEFWEAKNIFQAGDFSKKPKKYILVEFPYPSGAGLHMGHLRPYVAADVYARYYRMRGFETLFPIGWDAFGLPAENYAIKMGVHPSITTAQNIKNAKKQMQSWGLSFDWSREINTTDPDYYKWTQWLFLQFFKKGLAYEATGLINWCPKDKTGLANEEVIDGKCERCGTVVEKKELRQWYLKITEYAEKLLEGLKTLDKWPEAVKISQENWIGKKTGINISYKVDQKVNFVLLHGRGSSPEKAFLPWLKTELERLGFQVQIPAMPGGDEPDDEQQAEYVVKNTKIDQNTIILGHSFGGIVAMRLLEKGIKIKKLVLVSTPYLGRFSDGKVRKSVAEAISKGFDFDKIKKQALSFCSVSDITDHIVPLADGESLSKQLGGFFVKFKAQSPHFNGADESGLLEILAPHIICFTTRPDTNFGATFVVLGPEHPLLKNRNILNIEEKYWKEILKYQKKSAETSETDRLAEGRKKTGAFTGLYAINQLNNYKMPVYVSDYVLGNVGTGAVVGVPGHDKRDFEFAQMFKLPVVRVVQKNAGDTSPIEKIEQVQEEEGVMVNSEFLNGLNIREATEKIMGYMEVHGYGRRVVNYKLRDWVFSRQRYWGEPIPLIHCEDCGIVPVPDKDLPVKLPNVKKYEPTGTGESPLADILDWVKTKCPKCGRLAWRETNTMPQWAGSSWYWLRYADPRNAKQFSSIKNQKYWTPVDVYFGGMEHTTLHLLYSRFWNLFLYDQGLVTSREPYALRKPHGIVLGPDGEKMSKSRGNVVDPQLVVKKYGADVLRMYELFLGPHEAMVSWNDKGIVGVARFLDRVWNWANEIAEAPHQKKASGIGQEGAEGVKDTEKVDRELNKLIKKVTEDIENFRFNTSISAFMEFHNAIKDDFITLESVQKFLILLYPFAPHISEELSELVSKSAGQSISQKSVQQENWPEFNESVIIEKETEIVVQINGKVRAKITIASGSLEETVKAEALKLEVVKQALVDETVKRAIYIKDKLINLVI